MSVYLQLSGNQMAEVSPAARRVSISSTEDNADLEASLTSLRQLQIHIPSTVNESQDNMRGPGLNSSKSRSKSPSAARTFANKLRNSIASLASPHETSQTSQGNDTIWTAKSNYAMDTQLLFKRRITNLYNQVASLRSYVELNYSGFRKILKKYVSS